MALYTVIFEYREGTHIEQVQAPNEVEAFRAWGNKLNPNDIQHLGEKSKNRIVQDTKNKDYWPTAIKGMKNVWCAETSLSGLINIIKTHN